jgi:copper oxidase (laccase) domain-containing protein
VAESSLELFPALQALGSVRHGFIGRIAGIDVVTDRAEALARLDQFHSSLRQRLGLGGMAFATAEQVHGNDIAVIAEPLGGERCFDRVDGLITDRTDVALGIYVADCSAVFIVDPVRRAIGLVHSGKKGTELGIVPNAIGRMQEKFGSTPSDFVVQISPCIRPPHYEVDFASEIIRQARSCGVEQIEDTGRCTACDLHSYYSYRAEKGRTGRMLALLGLN